MVDGLKLVVDGKKGGGFEDLHVWQVSVELAKAIYTLTKLYPKEEQFGLVAQIRRSCISISSNIAEGSAKATKADFARFVSIALGSSAELKSQLIISRELGFISAEQLEHVIEKVNQTGRMLKGLQRSLKP